MEAVCRGAGMKMPQQVTISTEKAGCDRDQLADQFVLLSLPKHFHPEGVNLARQWCSQR
jgi:hypothetical protein